MATQKKKPLNPPKIVLSSAETTPTPKLVLYINKQKAWDIPVGMGLKSPLKWEEQKDPSNSLEEVIFQIALNSSSTSCEWDIYSKRKHPL